MARHASYSSMCNGMRDLLLVLSSCVSVSVAGGKPAVNRRATGRHCGAVAVAPCWGAVRPACFRSSCAQAARRSSRQNCPTCQSHARPRSCLRRSARQCSSDRLRCVNSRTRRSAARAPRSQERASECHTDSRHTAYAAVSKPSPPRRFAWRPLWTSRPRAGRRIRPRARPDPPGCIPGTARGEH